MLLQVILEGLGLGHCWFWSALRASAKGCWDGASLQPAVQQRCVKLGLTSTRKSTQSLLFKAVCVPGYVLVCVYGINGAKGFVQGFWQLLVILSVMNLIDRFWVDGYWVHTNAWTIPERRI